MGVEAETPNNQSVCYRNKRSILPVLSSRSRKGLEYSEPIERDRRDQSHFIGEFRLAERLWRLLPTNDATTAC